MCEEEIQWKDNRNLITIIMSKVNGKCFQNDYIEYSPTER